MEKHYSVNVEIRVTDKASSYPTISPIDFKITENLPRNTDPQRYLRKRVAEELARAFASVTPGIDNCDEGAEPDPLN